MPNTIKIKRRPVSGATGISGVALKNGELAFHERDDILYYGWGDTGDGTASSIVAIGGSGYIEGNTNLGYAVLSASNTFTGATNTFDNAVSVGGSLTSTGGDITASTGDLIASVGGVSAAAGDFIVSSVNGDTTIVGTLSVAANNFSVDASGNVDAAGNLDVGGSISSGTANVFTVSSAGAIAGASLALTGNASAVDGTFSGALSGNSVSATTSVTAATLSAASGAFSVDASGNTDVLSLDVNTDKFSVTSAGNTTNKGTFSAAFDSGSSTYLFTVSSTGVVAAASGSVTGNWYAGGVLSGNSLNINSSAFTVASNGALAVATNKFTVGAGGALAVDTNKFTVSAAGAVSVADDLSVSGDATIGTSGTAYIATDAARGIVTVGGSSAGIEVDNTTPEVNITGTTNVTGDLYASGTIYANNAEVATRAYVDAVKQGLDVKDSVRCATTAAVGNIALNNTTTTVDGVTLSNGDRVLVKNQTAGAENGIYVASTSGNWSRAADADDSDSFTAGLFVFVEEGTTNEDSGWVCTTNGTITVDTTAVAFSQFSGAGSVADGAGLSKIGNTLDVNVDDATIEIVNDALEVKSTYDATLAKLSANNAFTGANSFTNATGQTFRQAAGNDGVVLKGRYGGSNSYAVSVSTATLTANQAVELPDATGVVVLDTTVCAAISSCSIDGGTF